MGCCCSLAAAVTRIDNRVISLVDSSTSKKQGEREQEVMDPKDRSRGRA